MPRGGYRQGAGRKCGLPNLLTHELREKINAGRIIGFLQDMADGRIDGATLAERKDAAIALLRKVLPDCKQTDMNVNADQEYVINITPEHAQKILAAGKK